MPTLASTCPAVTNLFALVVLSIAEAIFAYAASPNPCIETVCVEPPVGVTLKAPFVLPSANV